jgi:hypothetical protein
MTDTDRGPSRPQKRPHTLADLPFPRHPAVRWFNPRMLLQTSKFVALSAIFGSYADKREVQASAQTPPFHDHSDAGEMWLDYVSDIGDGFDATYSLAYLLAQPKLDVERTDTAQTVPTPRGSMLVMGGDEVYPTASTKSYEEKTKGPYNAALPHADDPPTLFAVPGNHDWYDGLTAFMRFFCQGGWVGGWRTEQRRSYFAVKLPQRWWLLGIDIQFDTYIDKPQIDYFRTVAAEIKDGDGIILCTAKPSWVDGGGKHPEAYATLDYFIEVVLGKPAAQVRLMLAGDAHHYARYTEVGGDRSLITCGGGGAYLSATHTDNDPLELPPASLHADKVDPPPGTKFDRLAAYPRPEDSKRMAVRIFDRLPRRNRGFVELMVATQMFLSYVFVASMRRTGRAGGSLARTWEQLTPSWSAVSAFRQPLLLVTTVLLVWGTTLFYRRGHATGKIGGPAHGLAHIAVAIGVVWLAAQLPLPDSAPDWVSFWTRIVFAGLLGGALSTVLFAAYLYLAGLFGIHVNELFSAQSIEDYKSFLRMHIRPDGNLVVHPLTVPTVCRQWHVLRSDVEGDPWLEPDTAIQVRLAEPPLTIRREVPV